MDRSRSCKSPFRHRVFTMLGALLWACQAGVCHAQAPQERWSGSGMIAGRPAEFLLDTGAQWALVITAADSRRFGLEIEAELPPEAVLLDALSKPVEVVPPGGEPQQVSFGIMKEMSAPGLGFDAIIGWPVLKAYGTHYDRRRSILAIGPAAVPNLANARAFSILPREDLVFDAGTEENHVLVLLDSGYSGGVLLAPRVWEAWRRDHRDLPQSYFWAHWYSTGWVAVEQVLASELRLGRLILRNVIVGPFPDGLSDTVAIVGLAAFENHALVIDGPGGTVSVGESSTPLVVPAYNRLGASFGPDMSARVAERSPAADAGIRDGDVLVAIDGQAPDAYAATVSAHRVWEQPAGTRVLLTLQRGSEIIERSVTLRDFLTDVR